jgi:hypothetical protein
MTIYLTKLIAREIKRWTLLKAISFVGCLRFKTGLLLILSLKIHRKRLKSIKYELHPMMSNTTLKYSLALRHKLSQEKPKPLKWASCRYLQQTKITQTSNSLFKFPMPIACRIVIALYQMTRTDLTWTTTISKPPLTKIHQDTETNSLSLPTRTLRVY